MSPSRLLLDPPEQRSSTVRADDLAVEWLCVRRHFRVSHAAGAVLRLDQLSLARKARELEHLDISPASSLDRDREALHSMDNRTQRTARRSSLGIPRAAAESGPPESATQQKLSTATGSPCAPYSERVPELSARTVVAPPERR